MNAPAVPFSAFMAEALYGPSGFYTSGGRAGRRGDFITSPEVGPLFGAVVARFLDAEWVRLGRPDPFTVVDAGAGPGALARGVLAAAPDCGAALRYVCVEVAEHQHAHHPAGVESRTTMPDGPFVGVIVANELLDNLPFRLAVNDGGWREAYVVTLPDGRLVEQLSAPFDPLPPVLPATASLGARAPLQDAARDWIESALALLSAGTLVVLDYMTPTTAELAARPWRDWLRTYRQHERGGHYLADPGTQDITTEVAIDQLPEPDTVRTQAQWLQLHGIAELVEEGKRYWDAHAARPDLTAMRMRSRISESEALLDPAGLGAFTVTEWVRPIPSRSSRCAVEDAQQGSVHLLGRWVLTQSTTGSTPGRALGIGHAALVEQERSHRPLHPLRRVQIFVFARRQHVPDGERDELVETCWPRRVGIRGEVPHPARGPVEHVAQEPDVQERRGGPQAEVRPVAGPAVDLARSDARDIERVAVDVPDDPLQVGLVGDVNGMEASAEQRTVATDTVVGAPGVRGTEVLHRCGQPAVRTSEEQVVVVRDEAVREGLDTEAFVHLTQHSPELDPVTVGEEHDLAVHAAIHHVMDATVDIDALSSPGHAPHLDDGV